MIWRFFFLSFISLLSIVHADRHDEYVRMTEYYDRSIMGTRAQVAAIETASIEELERIESRLEEYLRDFERLYETSQQFLRDPFLRVEEIYEGSRKSLWSISEKIARARSLRAEKLYQLGAEGELEAQVMYEGISRDFGNVDEVLKELREAKRIAEKALDAVERGHAICCIGSKCFCSISCDGRSLLYRIEGFISRVTREIAKWPDQVAKEWEEKRAKVALLGLEAEEFDEKEMHRAAYEVRKGARALGKYLADYAFGEELEQLLAQGEVAEEKIRQFEERMDVLRISPLIQKVFSPELEKKKIEEFLREGTHKGVSSGMFHRICFDWSEECSPLIVTAGGEEVIIDIPQPGSPMWEKHMMEEGFLHIPSSEQLASHGISLRLMSVVSRGKRNSLVVFFKGEKPGVECGLSFSGLQIKYRFSDSPPWQLIDYHKGQLPAASRPQQNNFVFSNHEEPRPLDLGSYPLVDTLVTELKNDPIAIAQFVQNKIRLDERLGPWILRNPEVTLTSRKGSCWEQCLLLGYMLNRAGQKVQFAANEDDEMKRVGVGVLTNHGIKVLCPWIEDQRISLGFDVYSLLPDEFGSADRWLRRYLESEERIFTHVGPDGDDTAALLFARFVEAELSLQGLCLDDVGISCQRVEKQYRTWDDFPQFSGKYNLTHSPKKAGCQDMMADLEFIVPGKKQGVKKSFPIASIPMDGIPIHSRGHEYFIRYPGQEEFVHIDLGAHPSRLQLKVSMHPDVGEHTFEIESGEQTVLCFGFGGRSYYPPIKEDGQTMFDLLSFVGKVYLEKCAFGDELLAKLHGTTPKQMLTVGLVGRKKAQGKKIGGWLPYIDMFQRDHYFEESPVEQLATRQFSVLSLTNRSSNEHQVIRDIFQDPSPISTVALLRETHLKHLLNEENAPIQIARAENIKELTQQWKGFLDVLVSDPAGYSYLTPYGISGTVGALVIAPGAYMALIDSEKMMRGGIGQYVDQDIWSSCADKIGFNERHSYLYGPIESIDQDNISTSTDPKSDIRQLRKTVLQEVGDPVDIVSGAFYVDEVDLPTPGNFPIQICRNYNSQNPYLAHLGYGWKLSLNPDLVENEGKLFAAEADGTMVCYRYNIKTDRYEVHPDDNPGLYNFNQCGVGSVSSLFHSYIKGNELHGADGSVRIFKDNKLIRWIDPGGEVLTFSYDDEKLVYVESSSNNSIRIYYNNQGFIKQISTYDGRDVFYDYSAIGDLIRVTHPNGSVTVYEYDHQHQIVREKNPEGACVENVYDQEGRVVEQRSPNGPEQSMAVTATFEYQEDQTIVKDGNQGATLYKLFNRQIYQIIDPLGAITYQSWFVDHDTYFDAKEEQILTWEGEGGYPRSLKSFVDKRGLETSYLYDTHGNPTQITLNGQDIPKCTKTFVYNEHHLCIAETIGKQTTQTIYDKTFLFLPAKVESFHKDKTLSVDEYIYDHKGHIIQHTHNGSITQWEYDAYGFPTKQIQKTGTEDPDVITHYVHTKQGQCKKTITDDQTQIAVYDIVGNPIELEVFANNQLISGSYITYNANNQPITIQTPNSNNIQHITYHRNGQLKSSHQTSQGHDEEYEILDYDLLGNPLIEANPLGVCTLKTYDAIGNLLTETVEGHTISYAYEKGGLPIQITTPSGATTYRQYSSNGLLLSQTDPDGSTTNWKYDIYGRKTSEEKNGMLWTIHYDDANRRLIRSHFASGLSEIEEYDANGNLIRITDWGGYTTHRTYDALGRIKTETTPSGQETRWSYDKNIITCHLPNDEVTITEIQASKPTHICTYDPRGNLIAEIHESYDPYNDCHTRTEGDITTTTWNNAHNSPIKVQQGDITHTYQYDRAGKCISETNGEGHTTAYTYDRLGRLTHKYLPDGAQVTYAYDKDSNLIENRLPNGNIWKATYDQMGRRTSEKLLANSAITNHWKYTYVKDKLKSLKDPLGRTHTYRYDGFGRVMTEEVEGNTRSYNYDARGNLALALQETLLTNNGFFSFFVPNETETSKVYRTFDEDNRLISETIHLNNELIQELTQEWTPNSRLLHYGDHDRELTYQNNQLTQITTNNTQLNYTYNKSGNLQTKQTPHLHTTTQYNKTNLPSHVQTHLKDTTHTETLQWTPSGKIATHTAQNITQHYIYTPRGQLQQAGPHTYQFDTTIGNLTSTPTTQTTHTDPFGKALQETIGQNPIPTQYDTMGQVTTHGNQTHEYDPWGRLIQTQTPTTTWRASYDALGRRLQTTTTQNNHTEVHTSLYDPHTPHQEIGLRTPNHTYWKLHGPISLDAITDETGDTVTLHYNTLHHLTTVLTDHHTHTPQPPPPYGPQTPTTPTDLLTYALSLTWHSTTPDPTGLIPLGHRYYNPTTGHFITPDPIRHPHTLDLYTYASGDPINLHDPSGLHVNEIYKPLELVSGANIGPRTDRMQKAENWRRKHNRGVFEEVLREEADDSNLSNWDPEAYRELDRGYVNGIRNTLEMAESSRQQLEVYGGGKEFSLVYNPSRGLFQDVLNCLRNRRGYISPPAARLVIKWCKFASMNEGPSKKYLQDCHSGGAIHVKNALEAAPTPTRNRLIVVAIAPGAIVPKELCYESYNYVSKGRDFVPLTDIEGMRKYGDQVIYLKPHPKAKLWDHDFRSPTFRGVLRRHITEFDKMNGG